MASHLGTAKTVGAGVILTAVALLAACSGAQQPPTADGRPQGALSVAAAASLTSAFAAIETAFETVEPGVDVTISPGSSATLAQQIIEGAPFDVFAPADETTMARVAATDAIDGDITIFATNALQIIVPRGNPAGIGSLSDLARPGVVFVTCATNVPIGAYTAESLRKAGVRVTPASLEPDVKGIVAKVTAGEADAGIVYATDVIAARGAGEGIDIDARFNVVARYPIATIVDARNPSASAAWIAFVTGPRGREILTGYGFGPP